MKRKIFSTILATILIISAFPRPGLAADTDEQAKAVEYITTNKIFVGDGTGNLILESGLTRAELAVILTRLDYVDAPDGLSEWNDWGIEHFSSPEFQINPFTDVPAWATPYVEYCYQRSLMVGVAEQQFAPNLSVSPKMACTVILRYCGIPETDWSYNTSVEKATTLGLTPSTGLDGDIILRGTMAVLIYNGMHYVQDGEPVQDSQPKTPDEETSTTPPEVPGMTIDEMKAEIIRLTNAERINAGLSELVVLPALMDTAQTKAQDFLDNHYFGHISPIYGTPGEMIKAAIPQAKSAGENAAAWTKTPGEAFSIWLNSPEHYANILASKYTHAGVGIAEGVNGGYWWVLQFATIQ